MTVSGTRNRSAAAAMVAALAITSGCVSVGSFEPPTPVPDLSTLTVSEVATAAIGSMPSSVRVVVRNQNLVDVKIYAVSGEMVIPIGRVERFGEQVLRIPDFCHMRTGVVRLMADPVGYRRPVMARPIRVGPGSEINWVLKSGLAAAHPNWRSTDE